MTIHHESFLRGAVDGEMIIGGMGLVGIIVVVVFERRVDRHLATDYVLKSPSSIDGGFSRGSLSSERGAGGSRLTRSLYGADIRQTGGE